MNYFQNYLYNYLDDLYGMMSTPSMRLPNAVVVSFLKRLNRGLSTLDSLWARLGSARAAGARGWSDMSDQLRKFEVQVPQEFVRLLAAIGGVYLAVCYLDYIDAEYGLWLTWLLTPLVITFLLPAVLIVLIYTSAIIFHVYRLYRLRLVEGVNGDWRNAARVAVCALWDAHGWLWHGYEISGLENIPEGPCLIIYYHGALPVDMYYFIGRMYLLKRKMLYTVADRFMFKIPGWSIILDGLCVIPGSVQSCSSILKSGNQIAISPGGVYEAQFGDHYYDLKWKSRTGFAKVALEAKVPIVPMFTQNIREAFRTVGWLRWVWLRIYQATRIPLSPVYGGFPVKLLTHLGKPIPYDPSLTPQQLQLKVAQAIEAIRDEHQRIPGSILRGLIDRVYRVPKHPKKPPSKVTANGKCANGHVPTFQKDKPDEEIRHNDKYLDRNGEKETGDKKENDAHSIEDENTEKDVTKGSTAVKDTLKLVENSLTDKELDALGDVKNSQIDKDHNNDLTYVKDSLTKRKDKVVNGDTIVKQAGDCKMKVS